MSHYSTRDSRTTGFTLVELLVTISCMAVVFSGLCGVFLANQAEFDRQSGISTALVATRTACDEIGTQVENAMYAKVFTRYTSGDTLAICLPADSAYGTYVPVSANSYKYRNGQSWVFYLSDSTGNYYRPGNILWRATLAEWKNPVATVITPDTAWSCLPDTTQGRIAPITSVTFSMPFSWKSAMVNVTVSADYKASSTVASLTRTRKACLRSLDGYYAD